MHFLLINDDGYHAEGIRALARAAHAAGHRATICAPDRERSGASHSFTTANPLRARRFEEADASGWAITGTPADCARLGVYLLENDKPDMALAGINHGANAGGACIYSGTVGAAMEASMTGIPAIATSLDMGFTQSLGFDYTARLTIRLAEWAVAHPLARGCVYNLNVPDLPEDRIKGLRRATLSPLFLGEAKFEEGVSPIGVRHYWLKDGINVPMTDPNGDRVLLSAGYATLSPLTWDMALGMDMDLPDIRL